MTELSPEKYLKKLVGKTEIEDSLKRLDKLTQEEARMAIAQVLKATHTVDDRVREVTDQVIGVDNRVAGVDDRLATVDDRVATVDDRVVRVDDRLASVDDRVKVVDDKVAAVVDGARYVLSQPIKLIYWSDPTRWKTDKGCHPTSSH